MSHLTPVAMIAPYNTGETRKRVGSAKAGINASDKKIGAMGGIGDNSKS